MGEVASSNFLAILRSVAEENGSSIPEEGGTTRGARSVVKRYCGVVKKRVSCVYNKALRNSRFGCMQVWVSPPR